MKKKTATMKIRVKGKIGELEMEIPDSEHLWGHYIDKLKSIIQECADVVFKIDKQHVPEDDKIQGRDSH